MSPLQLTILSVIGTLLIITMPVTTKDFKELEALTAGSNKFALELYQAVKKPNENLVLSPISVQIVLALVHTGAFGATAKQIADVLHLPDDKQEVLKGHKELIEMLGSETVLKLATKIFIENTMNVKQEFQDGAKKYFLSEAGLEDFIGQPEQARGNINQWVESKTNNKIKDLLAEGSITSDTRMVLTNAIHFKANWAIQFNPKFTEKDADFYINANDKVKVEMMHKTDSYKYRDHKELDAKILELPYDGNDFKMVIILPNQIEGLPAVENKLLTLNLTDELSSLYSQKVEVSIPKFKIENTIELKDILGQMGIKDLFQPSANLSGISELPLYASKVVQKAFIEVNEEGTEAAAATAVYAVAASSAFPALPLQFHADHPYIYLITRNNILLFIGRITKP